MIRIMFLFIFLLVGPIMGHAGVSITNSGGGGGTTSPLTTNGDLYDYNGGQARLPIGSNGQCLVVSGGLPTWQVCSTSSIISSASTYYVCAKAASGTCVYNGDAGTVATPSDSNACTTKALPCATIAGASAKITGKILTAIVTFQLADTAGTGTDCYRPDNVIFENVVSSGAYGDALTVGSETITDQYPTAYIYIVGNTSTSSNVDLVGAISCGGTTSSINVGLRAVNTVLRVDGVEISYFKHGVVGFRSTILLDKVDGVSDNPNNAGCIDCTLVNGSQHSTVHLGGVSTVTNWDYAVVNTLSLMSTRTPSSYLNLTYSSSATCCDAIMVNEKSHMLLQGSTMSFAGTGTYGIFRAMTNSSINWNSDVTTNLTVNAPNAILNKAIQGSHIDESCGTGGGTCTLTSLLRRGFARNGSYISIYGFYSTNLGSSGNYMDNGSCIAYATSFPFPARCSFDSGVQDLTDVTFTAVLFANLGTPGNGIIRYCSDCTLASPCGGGGTGALAKRLNGIWVCN